MEVLLAILTAPLTVTSSLNTAAEPTSKAPSTVNPPLTETSSLKCPLPVAKNVPPMEVLPATSSVPPTVTLLFNAAAPTTVTVEAN